MLVNGIKEGLPTGSLAVITDIQRYSLHDGPGIRTVIFFKGCPLRCKWCQNPETYNPMPEIIYEKSECIGCGHCAEACPQHAISVKDGVLITDQARCTNCGECVLICPSKARNIVGKIYTADEVFDLAKRDYVFYKNSGGGVTLSGGEVTTQSFFAQKLILMMKDIGIHTAIETCGYSSPEDFRRVAFTCDLILFDIKHMDSEKHKQHTGVNNAMILQNLLDAIASGKKVIARYPLIPGFNDSDHDIESIGILCKNAGIEEIHLLPFHQAGETKWEGIGKNYSLKGWQGINVTTAMAVASTLKNYDIRVSIGGSGE